MTIPLLSLPRVLGTRLESVPHDVPYLHAEEDRVQQWREKLSAYQGLKVGIAWQGGAGYRSDHLRSIPLASFAPLAGVPGVRLFSLQKGHGSQEIGQLNGRFELIDLAASLDNEGDAFIDTAAAMKNLDLVVSSDTAIAHLAGALGVPVWVALSTAADWRWMRDREDSPWYPTMRLFRQTTLGLWSEVFAHGQRAGGPGRWALNRSLRGEIARAMQTVDQLLQSAIQLHRECQWSQARLQYQQVLAAEPRGPTSGTCSV